MRASHFARFRPVCPRCRAESGPAVPLELGLVVRAEGDRVEEGVLHCPRTGCLQEYPIIDGIPILVPQPRRFLAESLPVILARDDLSEAIEGLLGDAVGPGTAFDLQRQYLSAYGWDHWADLDPEEQATEPGPGAVRRCLARGLALATPRPDGPILDLGCAAGRTSFALAADSRDLVLGVDLNLALLRLARRVLIRGEVRYPRRRIGVVYDRRAFSARQTAAERVDFWCCDAMALPLAPATMGMVVALNVLDCLSSPLTGLAEIGTVLRPGGSAILATPYDWSATATQIDGWIGGHTQRGPHRGAAEPLLRALLTEGGHPQATFGVHLCAEDEIDWQVRSHDRSRTHYRSHLLCVRKPQEVC